MASVVLCRPLNPSAARSGSKTVADFGLVIAELRAGSCDFPPQNLIDVKGLPAGLQALTERAATLSEKGMWLYPEARGEADLK